MKPLALLTLLFSAALLIGCDTVSGSTRTVTVTQLPTAATVTTALNSTPGVQRVTQREVSPATSWGLYEGVIHDPAYNQFSFSTATTGGTLETRKDSKGIMTIRFYSIWMNHTPPKSQFDQTRSLLDAAYLSLRRADPSLPPPEALKETLMRYPSK